MKNLALIALVLFGFTANAQLKIPQVSPLTKVEQVVGLTTMNVSYNRPSAKGRKVYGELVPYGKNWRTGANENSTITFSDDVMVETKPLAKGKYAIFTTPKADAWDVIFYKTTDNWGLPEEWKEENVALKVTVKPENSAKMIETFTIGFNNITVDGCNLELEWEKTLIAVKIEVPTQKVVLKNIESTLAGPTAAQYYQSAQYFYQTNGDSKKALEYVNKALELNKAVDKPFWYLRLKALLQFKNGDKKGAIETAKLSLAGAEKEKNEDYIAQNKQSIIDWSK